MNRFHVRRAILGVGASAILTCFGGQAAGCAPGVRDEVHRGDEPRTSVPPKSGHAAENKTSSSRTPTSTDAGASAASDAEPADPLMPDLSQGEASFDPAIPADLEVKRAPTGHLLVRPLINGRPAGWFIFDTGAGICVVSPPAVEGLELRSQGGIQATGVGGTAPKRLFRADTLRLGPITLNDHPIMEADLTFLKQFLGEEISGVIGYGVLAMCIAEIDIERPRISLHDPASYALARGEWTALTLLERIPSVRASFEGRDGLFRVDTGAKGHLTFHQPAVERWNLLEGREVTDSKMGGVGGFVNAKSGAIAWFELGGVRTENVPTQFAIEAKGAFADASKDGNIGAELLRPFVIVMDYQGERAAFVKREP